MGSSVSVCHFLSMSDFIPAEVSALKSVERKSRYVPCGGKGALEIPIPYRALLSLGESGSLHT